MNTIDGILARASNDEKRILSILQKRGPLTKNDLLAALRTNFSTLNRLMLPLEEARLIAGIGSGASTGGRKPVLYDLDPKTFYILGIDISRSYVQVVVADPKMTILHKSTFSMDQTFTPIKTVQRIARLFDEALGKLGITKDKLLGAGLGTVGPLDRRQGIMLRPVSFAAPGWTGVNIKVMLNQVLGLEVDVDNGANTAVLAEHKLGIGRDHANVAYFNCSIGIRTGVISDGKIVRGIYDTEDAFGHMVIDFDGEPCVCGNYGCIDCYASIHAIVGKYRSSIKQGRVSKITRPIENIDYSDICRYAESNDALAQEIIINAATSLGVGLANYINLLNPDLVILNGPLISHSELYYRTCIQTASNRLYARELKQIAFSKGGNFADDAIALGAALMAMERRLS